MITYFFVVLSVMFVIIALILGAAFIYREERLEWKVFVSGLRNRAPYRCKARLEKIEQTPGKTWYTYKLYFLGVNDLWRPVVYFCSYTLEWERLKKVEHATFRRLHYAIIWPSGSQFKTGYIEKPARLLLSLVPLPAEKVA